MMMKFNDVIEELKKYDLLVSNDSCEEEFSYVSYDSNDVKEKTLFVCKGVTFKKEYLESAIEKGVSCYVSENDYEVSIPKIIVSDSRKALSVIATLFYPDDVFKIGITGTKGKTTTNYFIHNILKNHLGYKPGILATHYFYNGEEDGENHLTTPESLELHKHLNAMMKSGIKYMSMEVSSQAPKHDRVFGMNFDIGCFLNVSPDHISPLEHSDYDDYINSKIEFLKHSDTVIIYKHTDDFDRVLDAVKDKKVITFGFEDADYIISNITNDEGLSFDVNGKTYRIGMAGRFNVINATCAIVVSDLLGVSYENVIKGLLETTVSGRMNVFYGGPCPVIVDYAHNELSAKALYESLKEDYPGKNIKVVFGCPGDKGINRRRDMGLLAGQYASYIYLTAEDPGHSTVKEICDDIIKYIEKYHKNYEVIEDRKTAILKAIHEATSDDVIALLGKGDENYQMIDGEWLPYETDIVVVENELNKVKE